MSVNKYRYSPIAIILYNRPDSTERLFNSIFLMPLFENSLVYVLLMDREMNMIELQ